MTPDDLRARGITIDANNYDVYVTGGTYIPVRWTNARRLLRQDAVEKRRIHDLLLARENHGRSFHGGDLLIEQA
ncbi:MAG TPA: hypothetical protein VGQ65_21105 [Thermoanaerobaculia bacterium]|nr:hypothetical protein [Thermoanaerobaculia bacterium]